MESLEQMLIRHEGLELRPYRDSVGKLTIGVGRNLDDKGISKREALYLLATDIMEVQHELMQAFPWFYELTPDRRRVLANMAFNIGLPRLQTFKKMVAALELGHWQRAADEMLDSKWAVQVGRRATELANLMRTG